jgi:hypothetical protein
LKRKEKEVVSEENDLRNERKGEDDGSFKEGSEENIDTSQEAQKTKDPNQEILTNIKKLKELIEPFDGKNKKSTTRKYLAKSRLKKGR